MQTKRIKLGSGAHLLPFHHPAELAHRVAYLDHISQGRFLFGVGASGLPSDWALFDVDGNNGVHRDMTRESLDIILKIWANDGPFEYKGKYWNVSIPEPMYGTLEFFLRPYQQPHPPIGVASVSYKSPTLMIAGERGFIPMSLAPQRQDYCRRPLGGHRRGSAAHGQDAVTRRLAAGPRRVRGGHRRRGPADLALNGMLGRVWHN